jgi:hypothetical protein
MEDIIDLIATGSAASDVSDKIKEVLYAKAAERIDATKPLVAQGMFGEDGETSEFEDGEEIEDEETYGGEDQE